MASNKFVVCSAYRQKFVLGFLTSLLLSCNDPKKGRGNLQPLPSQSPTGFPTGQINPKNPPAKDKPREDPTVTDVDADPADNVPLGEVVRCDLIVIGGSSAAYASAYTAAWIWKQNGMKKVVCLTEPTDWVGGQFTSAGVSAVDFANYTTEFKGKSWAANSLSKKSVNMPQQLASWINSIAPFSSGAIDVYNNPGRCWVSNFCYSPESLLPLLQTDLVDVESHLRVFYNTVPKRVRRKNSKILNIDVVSRRSAVNKNFVPNSATAIWESRSSQMAQDWYSEKDSPSFLKKKYTLAGSVDFPVVIDASEFGDILALARTRYIQGAEAEEGKLDGIPDTCSQAITVPLAIKREVSSVAVPNWLTVKTASFDPERFKGTFYITPPGSNKSYTFEKVWAYRRIISKGNKLEEVVVGDVSMQNWGSGNDYGEDSFFLSRADAAKTRSDWTGGIKFKTWDMAEQRSLGWYLFLRSQHPEGASLSLANNYGTVTGLAKIPYLRDSRRSVGIDGFLLHYTGEQGIMDGFDFGDETVAIGAYVADIHSPDPKNCGLPNYLNTARSIAPVPYFLPMRALTNESVKNLLVAGKTMAQTFFANSSTRVHPVEFASGVAAGILGGYLVEINKDMHEAWAQKNDPSVQLFAKFAQRAALQRNGAVLLPLKWSE